MRVRGASEQVAMAIQHRIQASGLGPGDFLGREEDLAVDALRDAVVPAAVVDQHGALLRAIEKGDRARAERAMRAHLLHLRDVLSMVRERG